MRTLLTLLVLLSASVTTAYAQTPNPTVKQNLCLQDDRCRQHSMSAKELSKSGDLPAAIGEYEAAYREVQLPVFLYNIGRLHQRLGNPSQATEYYRRFLDAALDEDPEQRARAKQYLSQLSAVPAAAVPVAAVTAAQAPAAKKPIYKQWWLWTLTGVVVAGATAGIIAFVVTRPPAVDATGLPAYEPSF